jgi:scyllo-inositol 2-dehydrogenase (NADP+)
MIRVALIGFGKMGLSHCAIINTHPNVELVAVCDSAEYLLDIFSKYSHLKTYTNYRKLLASEDLDAVFVATPSRHHAEMVRAALEAGLHVFCEKPFCLDTADGLALAELAEKKGLVNQVGYHYRFVGAFREMKRLLDCNILSTVHHIRAEAYGPVVLRPKGRTWRTNKVEGGGCLYDYASHAIDLMNYMVGRPRAVGGTIMNRLFSGDVEDEVYSNFFYANGMTGQIASNWSDESCRKMSTKISIWGTNGKIVADRQELQVYIRDLSHAPAGFNKGWNTRYTTDLTEPVWFYLRGEEYSAQIHHFIEVIMTGKKSTLSTFRSAIDADFVAQAMTRDSEGKASANAHVEVVPSTGRPKAPGLLGGLRHPGARHAPISA